MEAQKIEQHETTVRLRSDFWKYWAGQTISNLGSSVTMFALPFLIYQLTGSALNLGIAMAATFVPYLLFGLPLGAWVDRIDRKRMMVLTDLARAGIVATIPLFAAMGWLSVWWIYAVEFIHSTLTICFEAGQFAAIPNLVSRDDLVTANGRIQASYSAASVLGPLLAGLLITIIPVSRLMLFDSLSFIISAGSLLLVARSFHSHDTRNKETSIGSDMIEGLRYVLRHPVLRNISLMMALVNFVNTTTYAQLVLFSKQQLQASDAQVGIETSFKNYSVLLRFIAFYDTFSQIIVCSRSNKRQSSGLAFAGSPFTRLKASRPWA